MASKNGKPTNKQRDAAIGQLYSRINELETGINEAFKVLRQLDSIVGMYVDMKKDGDKFNKYIAKKQKEMEKENDAKADGDADKPNLQGDTDGESSGTEGVREKE